MDEVDSKIKQFIQRLSRGLCAECGGKVTNYRQVGPAAYAEPCGHRIGRGNAFLLNKGIKEAEGAEKALIKETSND